jgi:1,4-dihydroxy-2-naphthoate polyprenyltransferase
VFPTAPSMRRPAPPANPPIGRLRALVAMVRPTQLGLVVIIAGNGLLLALWRSPRAPEVLGAAALALALLLIAAMAVHLANEAADHETDRLSRRTPFSGGSGALVASDMGPRVPLAISLFMAAIVTLATAASTITGLLSPIAGVLLWLGLAGGLAYSLPPFGAMRRGWGEPLNAFLGGLLLPLFMLSALAGSVTAVDVLAFTPFLLVVFASVMATAWPDRAADAATGKATMQVRLTPATLRRVNALAAVGFVAATFVAAATAAMPLALAGLLVAPLLVIGTARYTRTESPLANVGAMVCLALITTVTLSISLWTRTGSA